MEPWVDLVIVAGDPVKVEEQTRDTTDVQEDRNCGFFYDHCGGVFKD
jgi:hypothetical protein